MTIYEVVVGSKVKLSTVSLDEAEDYKQILNNDGWEAVIREQQVENHTFLSKVENE